MCTSDPAEDMNDYEVMVVEVLSSLREEELKRQTLADPLCQRLLGVIATGWPTVFKVVRAKVNEHPLPYSRRPRRMRCIVF